MWNLKKKKTQMNLVTKQKQKKDTNELSYKTEIDPQTENKLMVTNAKT